MFGSVTVLKENGQTPAAVASSMIYDAVGGTSTTTLPNTVYQYDLGGRLISTFDSATGVATTYTYKPNTNYVRTETSVISASSVVNPTDHGSMTTDQKTIGISERLFTDHYSLLIERSADARGSTRLATDATGKVVQDMNYGAFGNALGFNAATALTTYLYSSMPFDATSGNYYDHARYFDTGTGSFTQADYGYSGSLANPMTFLPYMFAGGDPINLSDLNGHAFSLAGLSISVSIMAGLNGILGATLGARNGVWGAVGGVVGGIDSTYIGMFSSFLVGPPIAFGAGAAVGAASELGITYGYSYLRTWNAVFTISLAGVVGSAIGYIAGAGTVEIAERLGQSILNRAGMYQIVENAFRNTSEIEQAGLRNMVVFAVQHPLDTMGVFNKAVAGALSEAAVDALKVFATNSAVTLTDEVAIYLVDEAQKFLQGLNNLAKLSQSEVT